MPAKLTLADSPSDSSDSEAKTASPDSDPDAYEWSLPLRGSRRLGTVWSGNQTPTRGRLSSAPAPRQKIWTREGKSWRRTSKAIEPTEITYPSLDDFSWATETPEENSPSLDDFSFIIDHHRFAESVAPTRTPIPTNHTQTSTRVSPSPMYATDRQILVRGTTRTA